MASTIDRSLTSVLCGIVVVVVNALKLVHLTADFPSGLTRSGVLYTDEGWYSLAAVNHALHRGWRLDGEINLIVMLPVGQLVQAAMFRLFGMHLAVARLTIALFSIALMWMVFTLVRRYTHARSAWLVVATLSTNLFLFAYSRLATADVMALTLMTLSIVTAVSFRTQADALVAAASGLILAAAILAKTNAAFGVPVMMFAIGRRARDWRARVVWTCSAALVCVAAVGAYDAYAIHFYREDFMFVQDNVIGSRLATTPLTLARNVRVAVREARAIGSALYWLALAGMAACACSAEARRNTLVQLACVWVGAGLLILGGIDYHPERYFLIFAIPAAVLFCMGLEALRDLFPARATVIVETVAATTLLGYGAAQIGAYTARPEFSFVEMTRGVAQAIARDERRMGAPFLIGSFAPSVSLATGLPGIDSDNGTRSLEWRVQEYRPNYLVSMSDRPAEAARLPGYALESLGHWDVFHNYYMHEPVCLFALRPRPAIVH